MLTSPVDLFEVGPKERSHWTFLIQTLWQILCILLRFLFVCLFTSFFERFFFPIIKTYRPILPSHNECGKRGDCFTDLVWGQNGRDRDRRLETEAMVKGVNLLPLGWGELLLHIGSEIH